MQPTLRKVIVLSLLLPSLALLHRSTTAQPRLCNSQSRGTAIAGTLGCGRAMTTVGTHHQLQNFTANHDYRWGTEELVAGLLWTADQLGPLLGKDRLAIGNLSKEGGGDLPETTSHTSGRDVDIPLLMANGEGQHIPSYYHHFDKDGISISHGGRYRFDVARNWKLVESLLQNPHFEIDFLMIYGPLRQMLLEHAKQLGVAQPLQDRAERLLRRPWAGVRPHDNHFHLRIRCPAEDLLSGCRDG